MLSVTRLRVLDGQLDALHSQLDRLVQQMPQAIKGMAVVIESEVECPVAALVTRLRELGMQPLAVVDGPLADAARELNLPVLSRETGRGRPESRSDSRSEPRAEPVAEAPAPVAVVQSRPARIVTEPVRSGQQIYADGCDLVVLNSVSAGAEVIADGCVHIYGPLRGRAIAGARGDESARIFCRKLEAELVSVAGIYAVAEQIKDGPWSDPAQIYLERGRLKIETHKI